jgi:site-specific recombinase XerD
MARKNDRQISLKIKDEVLTFYELFLSIYRPKILRGAPDLGFVFAGNKGGPIARANLARRITKLVRQETGLKWHNHLWRHHGMVLLRDHGGSLENGADLLGISLEAARRAYDKDRQAEAGDHLDKAAMAKLDAAKRK